MVEATPDRQLVQTWAASQVSPRTRTAYRYEGRRLVDRLSVPLAKATVADLQGYVAGLGDLAPATIGLAVSAVRSLYVFGIETGVLSTDPSRTLQAPPIKNVLAERILDEADVQRDNQDDGSASIRMRVAAVPLPQEERSSTEGSGTAA